VISYWKNRAKFRKTELDVDIISEPEPEKEPERRAEPETVEKEERTRKPLPVKKILIFSAIAVLIILLISGTIIIRNITTHEEEEVVVRTPPPVTAIHLDGLAPFFLPVKDAAGKDRFLKIGLTLDLSGPDLTNEIQKNLVILRENIYLLLKKKNISQLRSGDRRKKMVVEIKNTLNMALQTGTINAVYVTELIIL